MVQDKFDDTTHRLIAKHVGPWDYGLSTPSGQWLQLVRPCVMPWRSSPPGHPVALSGLIILLFNLPALAKTPFRETLQLVNVV